MLNIYFYVHIKNKENFLSSNFFVRPKINVYQFILKTINLRRFLQSILKKLKSDEK